LSFGNRAKILSPEIVVEEMRKLINEVSKNYSE